METELDALGGTWRFSSLRSGAHDDLELVLEHATAGTTVEAVTVGDRAIGPFRKVERTGVVATVVFDPAWAFHSFVESMVHHADPPDVGDRGVIKVLSASLYINFLRTYLWFDHPMNDGGRIYRIGTEDRFVNVLSPKPPQVTLDRG